MTDKVQKIKDWISKEQDGLMDAQGNFEYPEHEGAYHILCNLDAFIDSLQEEPVAPKALEDMLNAKTAAESLGIPQEEHDRIVDELIYGKEPEYLDDFLALEEIPPKFPLISQKKCMYTKDDFTNEDRKVLCDGCEEECKYAQREEPVNKDFELALAEMIDKAQKCVVEPWVVAAQWKDYLIELSKSEEPVSEELEEEIDNYVIRNGYDGLDSIEEVKYIANHFAKWQKEQIKEALLSEVLPCFMHGGEADEVVAKLEEVLNKKK